VAGSLSFCDQALIRFIRFHLVGGLFLAACHPAPEPPTLVLTARDFAYHMPDQVPAGLVHLRLVNQGADLHEAVLVRLTGTQASAGAYVDSVRANVEFPSFGTDVGGPGLTLPGATADVWVTLAPGRYAVVCWKGDHLRRGMAHDLTVIPSSRPAVSPPSAQATMRLLNYAFQVTGDFQVGPQVIHIQNAGTEYHEADLFRLPEGKTPEDYLHWLEQGEGGLPPVEPVAGLGDLAPGGEIWVQATLRPGRYFWICRISAPDGHPHSELGMIREFTVGQVTAGSRHTT